MNVSNFNAVEGDQSFRTAPDSSTTREGFDFSVLHYDRRRCEAMALEKQDGQGSTDGGRWRVGENFSRFVRKATAEQNYRRVFEEVV